jgi:hypothetical protein
MAIKKIQDSLAAIKIFQLITMFIFFLLSIIRLKLEKKIFFCPWQHFFQKILIYH